MKTGLYGQKLTLLEELKATTFMAHARLQTRPCFQALAACQLPLESYVGQLRALAMIHGVLESALDACTEARVAFVWNRDMRKLALLQQDLRFFEPQAVADLKEAVEAALKATGRLRVCALEQPLALLGWLYVLEGSTLGAVILRPMFARAFLLTGQDGLAYLHGYGRAVYARWAVYQQRMNSLELSAAEREQITSAANEFFTLLEPIFQALYPFSPESKTFTVTAINPEAGRHPVPTDEREIQAALKAADDCWQRFPYFEHRYGERGRRFARSDAAWLATLAQYEPAQITQQVRWLGRVLAARGMPTLLLQVQLELLFEELTAAIPGNKPAYEKLWFAAAELAAARRRRLSDDQAQVLAAGFDQAVGPEWSKKFRRTGAMLVSAVADDLEGCEGAVASLQPWLTDPARFPAEWVAAVQNTLTQAQEQARKTEGGASNQ
ncbi:MAG: biliverdin-producing heme oxygenase [Verrucomicrobiota bacterium]